MNKASPLQARLRAKKKFLVARAKIAHLTRRWFDDQGFLEVQTPFVVAHSSFDANLVPAEVRFEDGKTPREAFLRMSPELSLKKLLASGYPKVYELAPCFRSREDFGSPHHNAEFTLLEWYRSGADYRQAMRDVARLLDFLGRQLFSNKKTFQHGNQVYSLGAVKERSINDLFEEYASCSLRNLASWEGLLPIAHAKGYRQAKSLSEAFYFIFLSEIEPRLDPKTPTLVFDYPAFEAAFATTFQQACGKRYAERFELYWGGVELANACSELTDPTEQKRRMEAVRDGESHYQKGGVGCELDGEFLDSLKALKKPSAGVALGLDRLVMLLTGAKNISEVMAFSTNDETALKR